MEPVQFSLGGQGRSVAVVVWISGSDFITDVWAGGVDSGVTRSQETRLNEQEVRVNI